MEVDFRNPTKKDFWPWEKSATKLLLPEELILIRDGHVDNVVDFALAEKNNLEPSKIILELVLHGNYQKASLVLKKIICLNKELSDELLEGCTYSLFFLLQDEDLLSLPRNVDETRKYLDLT
ncbi:MAG: hypothetical protein UU12_C0023G0010 [Candidatus Woesebacteria bacterium GW2011_GWA2_40_7b]|uniref:Uncharacterized protein n=1 Tax=Candidatus Woesebacteria bacterium GW2011_GWA2_40_7b TaxID=1618563 RepID=A0A0G0W4Z7_9BACT|nr:MAG: hypothetical protein UU12_C0023G0010 [Candidatus Woesebacteria bacterium GW2011_GWA2_40_7b]